LPTAVAAAMMSGVDDRTTDRTQQDTDSIVLSVSETAARLGITPDAVRARLHRGTLVGEKRAGIWHVVFPMTPTEAGPTGTRQDATGTQQDTDRRAIDALIARLETENAYLRQVLDAEIEARRRADHLVAGFLERMPELPTGEPSRQDASQSENLAPRSDETSGVRPSSVVPVWRRWWRRMTGG
jgi:hypothetical protein